MDFLNLSGEKDFFPPEIVDIPVKIFEAEDEEEADEDIDRAVWTGLINQ